MSSVGQPLPRLDGRRKVTGAAHYSGDVPFPGGAYGTDRGCCAVRFENTTPIFTKSAITRASAMR